jgi:hypothetical protein
MVFVEQNGKNKGVCLLEGVRYQAGDVPALSAFVFRKVR